jgi:hypothetical protein
VVLPLAGAADQSRLAVSPAVHVAVAGKRTLDAGGALPVVVIVPVLLGLGAAGNRFRLRRGA